MTAKKSANPAYPDAHPTAPGGMSQPALVAEMVSKHGWDEAEATSMKWPDQITAVVEGRRERELEAEAAAKADDPVAEVMAEPTPPEYRSLLITDPDTYDFMFDGHAGAGPSASSRWMSCTASLAASREFLETLTLNQQKAFAVANIAARQGTTAHAVGETKARLILGEIDEEEANSILTDLALSPPDGEEFTEEMEDYVGEYVDLVKQYADDGHEIMIERRVTAVVPINDDEAYEVPGSVDFAALPIPGTDPYLVVGDLKYGNGVEVEAEENSQGRIYALGILTDLADEDGNLPGIEKIIYYIIQPRLGGIKVWEETVESLLEWRDNTLGPALALALAGPEGGATYVPSESACQFCPARGSCAALADDRMQKATEVFDAVMEAEHEGKEFLETGALPDDRLGSLLSQIEGLIKIRDEMKAEVNRRLQRGASVPGWHLVNYTPPRKWDDEAADKLQDEEGVWKKSLLTPKQALDKAKMDDSINASLLEELIVTQPIRPVAAPTTDRRKAWEGAPPEQMFKDETPKADKSKAKGKSKKKGKKK